MFEDEDIAYCVRQIGDEKEAPVVLKDLEQVYTLEKSSLKVGTLLRLLPEEIAEVEKIE